MSNQDSLVAQIKYRFDHEAAKKTLKEKYEAKMLFAAFGGMWRAGPNLLSTLNLLHSGVSDEAVLVDEYGNPCKVNVLLLKTEAMSRWQEQMNAWLIEFEELQRQR
jgi:hypothetical protein